MDNGPGFPNGVIRKKVEFNNVNVICLRQSLKDMMLSGYNRMPQPISGWYQQDIHVPHANLF